MQKSNLLVDVQLNLLGRPEMQKSAGYTRSSLLGDMIRVFKGEFDDSEAAPELKMQDSKTDFVRTEPSKWLKDISVSPIYAKDKNGQVIKCGCIEYQQLCIAKINAPSPSMKTYLATLEKYKPVKDKKENSE